MEILSEKKDVQVKMEMNFEEEEIEIFLDYYNENCSEEEKLQMKVSWAVNDLLLKVVEENSDK